MRFVFFAVLSLGPTVLHAEKLSPETAFFTGTLPLLNPGRNWVVAPETRGKKVVFGDFVFDAPDTQPLAFARLTFRSATTCGPDQKAFVDVLAEDDDGNLVTESHTEAPAKGAFAVPIAAPGSHVLRVWLTGFHCAGPSADFLLPTKD